MKNRDEVETVIKELREALARAGIILPSLGLDPVSYAHRTMPPLVELGRCNMDTARRLAKALGER
ncbi:MULTISPECIES: hypothetical protein [Streptomyces]|uniref:Uncharacterized protein n=1 Tax=Streptomyces yunnanensis TaxID=156453 RepID=A0ABY8AG59_9ACTN|nr:MULTISPECIES: hypothetical protein [Streptomyces]AJC58460.1 hypothetical protein GZL_05885 [Streptomyces sp. 769]WEB42671.1 hypothetical protein MOV08_27760 [Streptomyces yunnanensis]